MLFHVIQLYYVCNYRGMAEDYHGKKWCNIGPWALHNKTFFGKFSSGCQFNKTFYFVSDALTKAWAYPGRDSTLMVKVTYNEVTTMHNLLRR
jgi:hypothetical protein